MERQHWHRRWLLWQEAAVGARSKSGATGGKSPAHNAARIHAWHKREPSSFKAGRCSDTTSCRAPLALREQAEAADAPAPAMMLVVKAPLPEGYTFHRITDPPEGGSGLGWTMITARPNPPGGPGELAGVEVDDQLVGGTGSKCSATPPSGRAQPTDGSPLA